MEVSSRLARWIESEFPKSSAQRVLQELHGLPEALLGRQDPERIQAALVLHTGDWRTFQQRLHLLRLDWRDALVEADLANGDWPQRLDDVLGVGE